MTPEEMEARIAELESRLAQVDMKKPFLAVDVLIMGSNGLILVERKWPPLGWALPGGHVDYGESCEDAARREMKEETGLDVQLEELVGVYSSPDRDPRKHTISVVYLANAAGKAQAGDDAGKLRLVPTVHDLPENLCFDHRKIIMDASILSKKYGLDFFYGPKK